MIRKFRFGEPFYTESVVKDIENCFDTMPYFLEASSKVFTYPLEAEDIIYGLGENIRGINKRGFTYISRCMDGSRHTEDRNSLYAAHNFLIIDGKNDQFGVFFDTAGIVHFDLGETIINQCMITCEDDVDVYIIEEDTIAEIIHQFRQLIGRNYIPPKWAFGYIQSRWGYKDEADFREVAEQYQKNNIPLEGICLDIDYMKEYASFTIDETKFPNFKTFISDFQDQGIHLIPIIDAGIKVKEGYHVYEGGVKGNHFCKDEDGNDFKCGVWPGYCHFPDVLNPEHRYWFGEQYRSLTELGVDGFWNDMNEPSIFYTDKNLNEAYEMVDELRNEELDLTKYFSLRKKFATLTNNPKDYQLFYHTIDGKKVRHDKVHNLFGYNMTRAAKEALDRFDPTQRKLLFSRSSMIGMHRYSGIWTGDNHAWWSHLKLNIQQMPSLDMCGFLYAGADLGGFSGDTNEELMIRWITFGIFTPLMRNHSQSQRPQELYQFKQTDILRNLVNLRYALLPYLYSEFVKATLEYRSLFRPLAFDYPEDLDAKLIDDQLLVGESIMLAPIYTQNGKGRYVYLPEEMLMVRMQSEDNFTTKILPKGHHFIQVPLGELVFFIRKNHVVPMAKSALNTRAMDFSTLELLGFITDDCEYILYDDDGYSKDYQNPTHYHTLRLHPTDCECQTKTVKYKISMD